jgi:hypothetical protein
VSATIGYGLNLKEHWLTRECVTDLLISCHFAVNLIRLFRDKFAHLPVALHRAGSDCVEDQFSLMGQETRNMRNWSFGEGLERTRSIGRTEQIKVSKDHRINQVVPVISRGVPAAAIHV